MLTRRQLTTLGIALLIVTAVAVGAIVYFTFRLKTRGGIRTVGVEVYADPEGTMGVDYVDWGMISPGEHSNVTLYFKITSTVPTNLTMHTELYDPPAIEQFMTLTWDYDGSNLSPGEIRAITLRLDIAEDVTGITEFTFEIVITAAG